MKSEKVSLEYGSNECLFTAVTLIVNVENPISSLPRARGAHYNARSRQDETGCLNNTRVDVLNEISGWIKNNDKSAPWIFVLQGLAGTGKSTIAQTVCETMKQQGLLGASFFFSRSEASCSNPFLVFSTIAHQLAIRYAEFHGCLANALKNNPDIVGFKLEAQLEELIIEPLRACSHTFGDAPVVIVVDALDECRTYRTIILSLLHSMTSKVPISIKLFISFRPEHDLRTTLTAVAGRSDTHSFILHNVDAAVVRSDIEHFLRFRLSAVASRYPGIIDPCQWPSSNDITALADRSEKLFIFAATVVKFVESGTGHGPDRLKVLLSKRLSGGESSPYRFLDGLYLQVLQLAFPVNVDHEELELFRKIMGAIVVLYDPLTPDTLAQLLQIASHQVRTALLHLHSVIVVPDDHREIQLIHPTFREFMTERCPRDSQYFVDPVEYHQQLALMCFMVMERNLKKDICDIRDAWKLNAEVSDLGERIQKFIPASLQYACRHWATHLSECSSMLSGSQLAESALMSALLSFASLHLFHWLEVLSLIGRLEESLKSLRHAIDCISVS
jgi:hypothetical protein